MTLKLSTITGTPVVLPRARAWDSTTMTFGVPSNLGAGSGTVSVVTSESLDTLKVKLRMSKDATPGSGASVVTFTMPTGYTIDFSKLTTIRYIGWGSFTNANFGAETDVIALSTTTFALRKIGAAVNITGADFTAGAEFDLYLEIPIVEFGGGFLSYGQGLATSLKPGLISYSDTYTSPSTACTGAITASTSYTVSREGKLVTLNLPGVFGTASAAPSFQINPALPVGFRPPFSVRVPCLIYNSAANLNQPGALLISTAGVITVYREPLLTTNFTAAANAGLADNTGLCWSM